MCIYQLNGHGWKKFLFFYFKLLPNWILIISLVVLTVDQQRWFLRAADADTVWKSMWLDVYNILLHSIHKTVHMGKVFAFYLDSVWQKKNISYKITHYKTDYENSHQQSVLWFIIPQWSLLRLILRNVCSFTPNYCKPQIKDYFGGLNIKAHQW